SPSAPEIQDMRRWSNSFSQAAAVAGSNMTITGDGQAENLIGQRITASSFQLLEVKPILGGLFTQANEQPGNDHVVLLSRSLWQKRFGGDRSIIGRKLELDRQNYQVVGVIDRIFDHNASADIWTPLAFKPQDIEPGSSRAHNLDFIGRLKPGVT